MTYYSNILKMCGILVLYFCQRTWSKLLHSMYIYTGIQEQCRWLQGKVKFCWFYLWYTQLAHSSWFSWCSSFFWFLLMHRTVKCLWYGDVPLSHTVEEWLSVVCVHKVSGLRIWKKLAVMHMNKKPKQTAASVKSQ